MPVNTFAYNLDEILSTTLLNWREKGKMYDNIFKSNPTMWYLHEADRKKTEPGGERIMIPLQYGTNTTIANYTRYGLIDTTPQDNQTAAYYNWKQKAGSITIDGLSEFQNSEKHKIVKLLEAKIQETEDTMAEAINKDLWRITQETSGILSIPMFIVKAPQTTDTYSPGNISSVTYSWWRNQYQESSATTTKALIWEAKNCYNDCSKGGNKGKGGFPDLAITNQASYEAIENNMDEKSRYVEPDLNKKARSIGFQNIRFKNANMFWDEHVPDLYNGYEWDNASYGYGTLFFINTRYLYYVVGQGKDLKVGKFIEPENQDAKTAKMLHYHQMVCSQRRKQGNLHKIALTFSS